MTEYTTPMSGAQIAREMNITRQAVSYTIRKSMGKLYHHVLDNKLADGPFNTILYLMITLGVTNSDINDIQQFLKLFDKKIIAEVKEEASKMYNITH